MLHIDSETKRKYLLKGQFGLEMESLRVDEQGYLADTSHPFLDHPFIVKDFSESQTEINTKVEDSAKEAIKTLYEHYQTVQKELREREKRELLWPFSNPPFIRNEEDISVAHFQGEQSHKMDYRYYLSKRYGKYKMAFSGIHVNYSFHEKLLQMCFEDSGQASYQEYKNQFYVELAEKMAAYGWILVVLTAASPILDSSFMEKGKLGEDVFLGMASVRCSEMGYWNYFTPIFDYSSLETYVKSIADYVDSGLLYAPSELYYPIRLKSKGDKSLLDLQMNGVGYIELRMFDLNPFSPYGVEEKDIQFAQLLIAWLATIPREKLTDEKQVQAVQNYKNAARYDLNMAQIVMPNGKVCSVTDAGRDILSSMRTFYAGYPNEIQDILSFQKEKIEKEEKRYAWQVRKQYENGYVKNGLNLARIRQEDAYV